MTRGERRKRSRKKLRDAHHSLNTTSCARSMPPRILLEAYSIRHPGDSTIASYCADPFSEVDSRIRFET